MFNKLVNYSQKNLIESIKNYNFLENETSTSDKTISLFLQFDIDINWLEFQANTFAINAMDHGYIEIHKIFKCRQDEVQNIFFKLYIYSFVKCIYNGWNYSNISERANLGNAFSGHCDIYHVIKSTGNSGIMDDVYTSFKIDCGSITDKQAVLLRIISKFKFLAEYKKFSNSPFGSDSFFIPTLERYFNYLRENYYAREYHQQGADENPVKRVNSDNESLGRLQISTLNTGMESSSSILNFNNSPIMNCFLGESNKLVFSPVRNGIPMEFNRSFFFSKSVFLKLKQDLNDLDLIGKHYHIMELGAKQNHLVCSEVYTITGIKARYSTSPKDGSGIKIPTPIKFLEYFEKYQDKFEEIIDFIVETNTENLIEYLETKLTPK